MSRPFASAFLLALAACVHTAPTPRYGAPPPPPGPTGTTTTSTATGPTNGVTIATSTTGPTGPTLVVAGSTAPSPTTAASAQLVAGGSAKDFLERIPFQIWPTLGGRSVGLVIEPSSSLGPAIGWSRFFMPATPPAARADYWFFTEGGSAQAVYFASRGEGHNFLRTWSVPTPSGEAQFDAAMFAPDTPNQLGLGGPAHLVEVEVNAGLGAVPNLHFVVTRGRVVDGTDAYPLRAGDALATARAQWDQWLAATAADRAALLARADREAPGKPFGAETEVTEGGMFPTWLDGERVLRVAFYQRTVHTSQRTEERVVAHHCPRGAPCMPPSPQQVVFARRYGVEAALTIDLDDHGRIARVVTFAPAALTPTFEDPDIP